jgi:hypothetical protein
VAISFGNFPKSSLHHVVWDLKKKKKHGEFSPQKKITGQK